jgi:hypothetical protein
MTQKQINQMCQTHAMCVDATIERMMTQFGLALWQLQHRFDQADGEEFILCERYGYHIEKGWEGDGLFTCTATPGHFATTATGDWLWVNDKLRVDPIRIGRPERKIMEGYNGR